MAKQALKQREAKRERLVRQYAKRREALKTIIADVNATEDARWQAQLRLQRLPRNASPVRSRSRCHLTGRPRGVYRKFGLGRNKLREHAMQGDVPGLVKASW